MSSCWLQLHCNPSACGVQDAVAEVSNIVPPLKGADMDFVALAKQSFLPVDVAGDRQYLVSLRHGVLLDKIILMALLKGQDFASSDNGSRTA